MSESQKQKDETDVKTPEVQDEWMIRRCDVYDEEYSDCVSVRARFNQYFIYGHTIDCSQWKRASVNCYKWTDNQDQNAAKELVEAEKVRRKERLLPHYQNDVWKKRKTPPENWNGPLPEYLQREYESSYLNLKGKELRGKLLLPLILMYLLLHLVQYCD